VGAEGIGGIDSKHFLIARNEKDFAESTFNLIQDENLRNRIIKNAFNLVKENYDACKWTEKLLKLNS